jgi:hypothetical protein
VKRSSLFTGMERGRRNEVPHGLLPALRAFLYPCEFH